MLVLDTSVLIELIEESPRVAKIMSEMGEGPAITTSICAHELLMGARTGKERSIAEGLLQQMTVLEYDYEAARSSVSIAQALERAGKMVNSFDVLIAGICAVNNARIASFDKDFKKIGQIESLIFS